MTDPTINPNSASRRHAMDDAQRVLEAEHELLPYPLHAARTVPIGYNPSVALYRMAVARAAGARERRWEFQKTSKRERRLRETDHCVEVILLSQAALESWINWGHLQSGLSPKDSWISRWTKGCSVIAASKGLPGQDLFHLMLLRSLMNLERGETS